jgi:hypothetical protein
MMSARLPTWSLCLWVRITSPTADQSTPTWAMASSIEPALPPTPVSTMAAWAPRTRTYADTNPRLTRCQANSSRAGGTAPGGEPSADGSLGGCEPGVGVEPAAEADGRVVACAPGEQAATLMTASANAPRPRSAMKVRRSIGCNMRLPGQQWTSPQPRIRRPVPPRIAWDGRA